MGKLKKFIFVTLRIKKYQWLSNCKHVVGKPVVLHPLLLHGKGKIAFGMQVQIGVIASPKFYSHYSYIEARYENSEVSIGNNVAINNNFSAVAFSKITIEDNVLIGVNCSIIDSDAHELEYDKRRAINPISKAVHIKENVFIGSNVTILKGVTIGKNAVIGNGAIVTKDIVDNVIAAGNPAREIRRL
jgi:galactoside O-acetyltransferase